MNGSAYRRRLRRSASTRACRLPLLLSQLGERVNSWDDGVTQRNRIAAKQIYLPRPLV